MNRHLTSTGCATIKVSFGNSNLPDLPNHWVGRLQFTYFGIITYLGERF